MKSKTYLVTNIRLENNNEPYETAIPAVYSDYDVLSEPFLRTQAVNFRDINFDHVEIDYTGRYWTGHYQPQSFIMDIIDAKYEQTVPVKVTPMPMSAMVLTIDDEEVDGAGIELAIFMKLQEFLPIDFLVEYI